MKKELKLLLKNVPSLLIVLFVISIICMNLLANKTLIQLDWIAIDGGIVISWLSFLTMDIVTKRFGYKASNQLSVIATLVNLLCCGIFYIVSIIPSNADDYTIFNQIFGGTWFILLGSTIAFIPSAFINNILNYLIGRLFKKESKIEYITRTYVSTFIGQFLDNLIFSILVFMLFAPIYWDGFSWTFIQCLMCALTGAVVELLFEVIFSPIGYKICKKMERENIGKEYLDYLNENSNNRN